MNQRQQFPITMLRLMEEDDKIVILLCDVGTFAFREHMERWPDRCVNMGTCEGATVSFASGMALEGYFPVISTIEPFLVRRAFEQILLGFGHQKLSGMFVTVGANRAYEAMGPSHWDDECAGLMLTVPGIDCAWTPTDAWHLNELLPVLCKQRALAYVRLRT